MEEQKGYSSESRAVLVIVMLLTGIGLIMVYSASVYTNPVYAFKQLIWVILGYAAFFTASRINHEWYSKYGNYILILACFGLVSVFIPRFSVVSRGAKRWINLFGVTIQPSEFAKVAIILYMASYLARERLFVSELRGLVKPGVIMALVFFLIVMEPDFGTAILVEVVAFVLIFAAGARLIYAGPVVLASIPCAYLMIVNVAYRRERLMIFLNPWADAAGKGYQLVQSLITLGSGGIRGVGLGKGIQKCFFLPEPHTDFIFAVIGEELGFIGIAAVMVLYCALFYCAYRIICKSQTVLARLTALGILLMISFQVIINIAVVTGSCPTKGISLPLISYGGSSMLCTMYALGILVNIGNNSLVADSPKYIGARKWTQE